MKNVFIGVLLSIAVSVFAAEPKGEGIVTPTPEHMAWADAELGVLIHFDLQVFQPKYQWRRWGSHPDL